MKIFLDDVREPKDCLGYMHTRIGALNPIYSEEWIIVRNYDEFKSIVNDSVGKITHVSFDHDLAEEHYDPKMNVSDEDYNALEATFKEKTGLDCAKYLKRIYSEYRYKLPVMFVHSMNPVGTKNIINLFK